MTETIERNATAQVAKRDTPTVPRASLSQIFAEARKWAVRMKGFECQN